METEPNRDRASALDHTAAAIENGELAVYPTETVYGLGADALDRAAIERVFEIKGRPRDRPLSLAIGGIETVHEYAAPTDREVAFMQAFLPGAVTVLMERRPVVPDALVAGGDRVGIRVPDHDLAVALARRCGPITATSANRSGEANARRVADLDPAIREATTVLDGGPTPGGESTVVDVDADDIVRRGRGAEAIEAWLDAH
jgi:L-threonylcarbamoyladenylate synthase